MSAADAGTLTDQQALLALADLRQILERQAGRNPIWSDALGQWAPPLEPPAQDIDHLTGLAAWICYKIPPATRDAARELKRSLATAVEPVASAAAAEALVSPAAWVCYETTPGAPVVCTVHVRLSEEEATSWAAAALGDPMCARTAIKVPVARKDRSG